MESTHSSSVDLRPSGDDIAWHAIRVQSKFERITSTVLRGKGYEEFLPLYSARRRWSDRIKQLELPLFPGYLFCRFDPSDRLVPILESPGVIGIVGAGRVPIAVPDQEIEAIRAVVRSGFPIEPWSGLKVGARVVIERGPLTGVEGIVLEHQKQNILVVSVTLLQRSVAVKFDSCGVRALSEPTRAARGYAMA